MGRLFDKKSIFSDPCGDFGGSKYVDGVHELENYAENHGSCRG